MFGSRKRGRTPVSPAQRVCGICFSLFIMLQTPLLTIPITRDGRIVDTPMSAVEVATIGLYRAYPDFVPLMDILVYPGAWWKMASKELVQCLARAKSCAPKRLVDGYGACVYCITKPASTVQDCASPMQYGTLTTLRLDHCAP